MCINTFECGRENGIFVSHRARAERADSILPMAGRSDRSAASPTPSVRAILCLLFPACTAVCDRRAETGCPYPRAPC